MTQYFRITAYHEKENISAIFDSNGMFEKLWQFSSYLIQKGFNIVEVSSDDKFLDVNIEKAEHDSEHLLLRSHSKEQPVKTTQTIDGISYQAIKVGDKIYIPDKTITV